nr:hypothetical protein CFP56_63957 [Quercus suber]
MRRITSRSLTALHHWRAVSSSPSTGPKPPIPKPRPFKSPSVEERLTRHQAYEGSQTAEPQRVTWPWPFSSLSGPPRNPRAETAHSPTFYNAEPKDPNRGLEAARAAIVTGKLDPRYRGARNRVLMIIVALPFVIVLSYELMQRRFYGKAKKVRGARVEGQQQESEYGSVPGKVWDETGDRR